MPLKILKKIKPRKYQEEIYKTCKNKNCLVVLPTGIGKTLIGLMLAIDRQKSFPSSKILFLAPTRPLAEQHLEYFKKYLPELFAELTLFTGKINSEKRKKLWNISDIIFSTPQCISNDLKNKIYDLKDVSLLIEDECHRCLKNYSYTYVAKKYKEQAKNLRILGLTASPGKDKKTMEQIAKNLEIESIELRTRDSEDVKQYLQELKFKVIRVEFPKEFKKLTFLIKKIYEKKINELKNRKLLFKPANKISLLETQAEIMKSIFSGNKNFNLLAGSSVCAQAIKLSHLIELLETQTLYTALKYIKTIFEQANKNTSKAVKQLVKDSNFNEAYIKINELISKNLEHPKLFELKDIIKESIKQNSNNKIIIFSQYRNTGIKICRELNKISGIKSKVFVGQTKKEESGLSQKEQREILNEFKKGKINIICATSIAEEGLDIPEVNSVIFYEPVPSTIRKIQRAGRTARLIKGELIILITKDTLDEIFYYVSISKEKRMYKAIKNLKQDLDNGVSLNIKINEKQEKDKQKNLFNY